MALLDPLPTRWHEITKMMIGVMMTMMMMVMVVGVSPLANQVTVELLMMINGYENYHQGASSRMLSS